MKRLCLSDQAADFFRRACLFVELGEQIIAFADIGSSGDSKLEHFDCKGVLETVMQQFSKLLQQLYKICVMKITVA